MSDSNLPDHVRLKDFLMRRHEAALKDLLDAQAIVQHPTQKGDITEGVWLTLLRRYLPDRYQARAAFVVDHLGQLSDQIDIVVHDALYTPFILEFGGFDIVPIESVYCAFEVKQQINRENCQYAAKKVGSVRTLKKANKQTTEVEGVREKKIISGILATHSGWTSNLPSHLSVWSTNMQPNQSLDFFVAAKGFVAVKKGQRIHVDRGQGQISRFLLTLADELQKIGTVLPIDMEKYIDVLD